MTKWRNIMQINLAIILDRLEGVTILHTRTGRHAECTLKYLRFYQPGEKMREDTLYLTTAEKLPPEPPKEGRIYLLCMGYPPAEYAVSDRVEYVCFSISEDINRLFQKVLEIFYYYDEFDSRIKDMIIEGRRLEDFRKIALEIFGDPVTVFGIHEKLLLLAYDGERSEGLDYYKNCEEYLPEDEKSILYADKEFMRTFETRRADFSAMTAYKTNIIYYNLYSHGNYMGRVFIEDAYRPFRDGDYGLIEWFGEYVKVILNQTPQFHFQTSREFEQMFQELSMRQGNYREEYEQVLAAQGWGLFDEYLCVAITLNESPERDKILNEGAFYLTVLLDGQYLFIHQNYIIQIMNLSKSSYSYGEVMRRMKIFLQNNGLWAGTSTTFGDFREYPGCLRQAKLMAAYALEDRQAKLYEFDKNVFPMMMGQLKKAGNGNIYYTRALKNLFLYDKENHSALAETLKCYLDNNMNISKTNEQLFIARTTCLYRLRRIREITHLDMEDPETSLYVKLVLQLGMQQ